MLVRMGMGISRQRKEPVMNATTVAVDLAKSVFELAVADAAWRVTEQHRLTRSQFERWFMNRDVSLVIMEAWIQAIAPGGEKPVNRNVCIEPQTPRLSLALKTLPKRANTISTVGQAIVFNTSCKLSAQRQ
jgi:hypothetical protein